MAHKRPFEFNRISDGAADGAARGGARYVWQPPTALPALDATSDPDDPLEDPVGSGRAGHADRRAKSPQSPNDRVIQTWPEADTSGPAL